MLESATPTPDMPWQGAEGSFSLRAVCLLCCRAGDVPALHCRGAQRPGPLREALGLASYRIVYHDHVVVARDIAIFKYTANLSTQ